MKDAYKDADGVKINGRRVLVDIERGRTVDDWKPKRLGGGLGGEGRLPKEPKKKKKGSGPLTAEDFGYGSRPDRGYHGFSRGGDGFRGGNGRSYSGGGRDSRSGYGGPGYRDARPSGDSEGRRDYGGYRDRDRDRDRDRRDRDRDYDRKRDRRDRDREGDRYSSRRHSGDARDRSRSPQDRSYKRSRYSDERDHRERDREHHRGPYRAPSGGGEVEDGELP